MEGIISLLVVGLFAFAGYKYYKLEQKREKEKQAALEASPKYKLQKLWERARSFGDSHDFVPAQNELKSFMRTHSPSPPIEIQEAFIKGATDLMMSHVLGAIVEPPEEPSQEIIYKLTQNYNQFIKNNEERTLNIVVSDLKAKYAAFVKHLPRAVLTNGGDSGLTVLFEQYIQNGAAVEAIRQLLRPLSVRPFQSNEPLWKLPKDYEPIPDWRKSKQDGSYDLYVQLTRSPFQQMANVKVPILIPTERRFEHTWVLGPWGAGKTQLLQYLIGRDIAGPVANGDASLVVMDSQGDMIEQIRSLSLFHPDRPLFNKLIVIEPDVEHPLALNPFDMGQMDSIKPQDREAITNNALDLLTGVFNSLGERAELSPMQATLYRYTLRLLLAIPEATLYTFNEILIKGVGPYREHIARLEPPARMFFETQFDDTEFTKRRKEVQWRLSLVMENTTFARMFTAPRSKLDLFKELNSSKIILISTNKAMLGEDRTRLFGQFFIAMLLLASQKRATLQRENRLPTYVYVDEAQEYIATDPNIATILDQARKQRIGLILANQRSVQITAPNVLDALLTTSIKFVHTDNDRDTHLVARPMKTTPEFIASQPERHFALHVREHTPSALSVEVPFFKMENADHISSRDVEAHRQRMRERYSYSPTEPRSPKPPKDRDIDHIDI